jgi:hypothetical protein
MTTNEQLELGFNAPSTRILGRRREERVARAKWWFDKMRAAVEQAMDWQQPRQARSEQLWIPGANRSLKY